MSEIDRVHRRRSCRPDHRPDGTKEVGQPIRPQGGRTPDHRADPMDRQHRPARNAASGGAAQSDGARPDHPGRRGAGAAAARRRRRLRRRRTSPTRGAPCRRAWTVSEDLKTPPHMPLAVDKVRYVGDGGRSGRRDRPVRRGRRARGDRGRLRAAAGGRRHDGGAHRRRPAGPRRRSPTTAASPFRLDYGDFEASRGRAEVDPQAAVHTASGSSRTRWNRVRSWCSRYRPPAR